MNFTQQKEFLRASDRLAAALHALGRGFFIQD